MSFFASYTSKHSLKYPLLATSVKVEFKQTPKSLDYDVKLEYGELQIGSELEASFGAKHKGDYDVEFELYGFDNKVLEILYVGLIHHILIGLMEHHVT